MGHQAIPLILSGLFALVAIEDCPAQPTKVTTTPERHGIALFGARSQHLDLMLAMFDDEGPGKRLRTECKIRNDPTTQALLDLAMILATKGLAATKDDDPDFDSVEESLPKVLAREQRAR